MKSNRSRRSMYTQNRAEAYEFQVHPCGNPVVPMAVPVAPTSDDQPSAVDFGTETWIMPSGKAAYRAALAIGRGVDVESHLVALGGVRAVAQTGSWIRDRHEDNDE